VTSLLKDIAVDGALVGAGVAFLGKAHEIAISTRKAHGSMFKWDKNIAMRCLQDNIRGTITAGVVAAIAFSTASWVGHVVSNKKSENEPSSFLR
jgi:hypothetical protein